MICPSCRQDAPSLVRGLRVCCAACGAPLGLASASGAVNFAGRPARIGAGLASVVGWIVLAVGLLAALLIGALFQAIWPAGIVGWVLGAIIGIPCSAIGLSLLFGGRKLRSMGQASERDARTHAIFALAGGQGGIVTAGDAARALSLRVEESDALLTQMANESDGRITLEVDDNGGLAYHFHDIRPLRVETPPGPRMRVPQVNQAPRVIDAELIDETVEERPGRASR